MNQSQFIVFIFTIVISGLIITDVASVYYKELPIREHFIKICGIAQFAGGLIICLGYVFQIIKIQKTKSVQDLSEVQLITIFMACMLFELYAIHNIGATLEFFITNTISCIMTVIVLIQYWVFKNEIETSPTELNLSQRPQTPFLKRLNKETLV